MLSEEILLRPIPGPVIPENIQGFITAKQSTKLNTFFSQEKHLFSFDISNSDMALERKISPMGGKIYHNISA